MQYEGLRRRSSHIRKVRLNKFGTSPAKATAMHLAHGSALHTNPPSYDMNFAACQVRVRKRGHVKWHQTLSAPQKSQISCGDTDWSGSTTRTCMRPCRTTTNQKPRIYVWNFSHGSPFAFTTTLSWSRRLHGSGRKNSPGVGSFSTGRSISRISLYDSTNDDGTARASLGSEV